MPGVEFHGILYQLYSHVSYKRTGICKLKANCQFAAVLRYGLVRGNGIAFWFSGLVWVTAELKPSYT